jgi:tetratricopeptide (TPR) repeat protein
MLRRATSIALLIAAAFVTFAPAAGFAFLNWDDQAVIVDNTALAAPGVVRWAFTTTYMEHYQPVSWLLWAALRGSVPPDPGRFHAANLVLHLIVIALVWIVSREVLRRALPASTDRVHDLVSTVAAVIYGIHPLRVEVVAWVSAMPYALATALALATVWLWLRATARSPRVPWLSLGVFAISLAARPLALGVPVVLAVLDRWLFGRSLRGSVSRALPFVLLAAAAAVVEAVARAPGLAEAPWAYRLQSALTAPFVYAWHTLAPRALTPLDVLPLQPVANPMLTGAALIGLFGVTAVAWRLRTTVPALLAGWISYLAFLAPAVGLVPSGLQATADRYAYLPGVVLALGLAGGGAAWLAQRFVGARLALAGAAVLAAVLAVLARDTLRHWSDSLTLWTRVVSLDRGNDVGLYNLGAALSAAGQPDAAAERYRAALAVNPAHAEARMNLDRLDAARLERDGNELAATGRLAEASARYEAALARDPTRTHSRAALGMALASLGRTREAIPHLREALKQGETDVEVPNALAGLLLETGNLREARMILEAALQAHPNDVGSAHNLARLLVMTPGLPAQDRMRAFRLAEAVVQTTGQQDARALDTLAAALAAIGRFADARQINARAVAVATAQGDRELAAQITVRGRAYRK